MTVRRNSEHHHPEYLSKTDQHRFEDRIVKELQDLRGDVEKLTYRTTILLGGLGLIAFLLPIIAPFMRSLLGLTAP